MAQRRMYTLTEAMELAQVSRRTMYTWIETGYLEAVKVGGRWKVPPEEIDRITGGKLKSYGRRSYSDKPQDMSDNYQ